MTAPYGPPQSHPWARPSVFPGFQEANTPIFASDLADTNVPPPVPPGFPASTNYTESVPATATEEDGEGDSEEEEWIERNNQEAGRGVQKRLYLTPQGTFSHEYPVPLSVENSVEPRYKESSSHPNEFSTIKYTAATCDPSGFTPDNGYTLRQKEWGRTTELLITCTCYNENKILLARTLDGVFANIRDISRSSSRFWRGTDEEGRGHAWKKIVVCLVIDGISSCDLGSLDLLATLGAYQDLMKREIDGKETVAHVFEYTTQLSVDPSLRLVVPSPGHKNNFVPVQFLLCIKQKNSKKISSHRWALQAFAPQLQPEVVILIDVGTKAKQNSLYELWSAFYNGVPLFLAPDRKRVV